MLLERYYSTVKGVEGAVEVFLNPTLDELKELAKADEDLDNEFNHNNPSSKTIRAFLLPDDKVLAWNEFKAEHNQMATFLNIKSRKPIPIYIHMSSNFKQAEKVEVSLFNIELFGYDRIDDEKLLNDMVDKNRYLNGLLQGKDVYESAYNQYLNKLLFTELSVRSGEIELKTGLDYGYDEDMADMEFDVDGQKYVFVASKYRFKTDSMLYKLPKAVSNVVAPLTDIQAYEIKFYKVEGRMRTDIVGGVKNPARVFGAVGKILKDWLANVRPKVFFFNAEELSRQQLYDTFVKLIEKQTIYRLNDKYNKAIEDSKHAKGKIYAFSK